MDFKRMKIKLIIFDWDDVFTLGSKDGYFKCYHETLTELGVNLSPEEEKRRLISKWGQSHVEELKGCLENRLELLDKACELYEKKLFGDTFINCLRLVEGSKEFLERLSKQYTLCIATGLHPKVFKELIVPKFGIPDVFAQIISAYDVAADQQKPSPYTAELILKTQGVLPEEAVLVGDAANDMLMAKAAGITPVTVLTGHLKKEEAQKLGIVYIINDVTELERVLAAI